MDATEEGLTVVKQYNPVCYRRARRVPVVSVTQRRPAAAPGKRPALVAAVKRVLEKLERIEPFSVQWGMLCGMGFASEQRLQEFLACHE